MKNDLFWNTLGSTMWGINSFIMLAVVSRFSSVEQTGSFSIAFTSAQLLYVVGIFGTAHYQMTDYEEQYSFQSYFRVRMLSCILMVLGCGGTIFALNFTGYKAVYTVILTGFMLLNVVGDLYQSLFFQKKRLDLSGAALFYRTFWSLIAFCTVLILTRNVLYALLVQIIVNLVLTSYYICYISPQFIHKYRTDASRSVSGLLKECIPLFFSLLLMNVIISASKYGVELLMNDTAQGYYSMLFMPAQVINLCSQFLFKPFLKQYSETLVEKRYADFFKLLRNQVVGVMAFTAVCCVGAYMVGIPVLSIFYGCDLSGFTLPLVLVVFGGGIFALCQLFYYILVILRLQKEILMIYGMAGILSVVMAYGLVTRYEIVGGVVSFIFAHIFILAEYIGVLCWKLRRK